MAEGSVLGANSFLKNQRNLGQFMVEVPRPIKKRKREKMYHYAKELGYEF